MTGAVTWEVLAWVVGIITLAGGTVAGFLYWVWTLVQTGKKTLADELGKRDFTIEAVAARCKLADEQIGRELTDYKMHVGETFATKAGVSAAVERVEGAVERMTGQMDNGFDRLTQRIDRLLETRGDEPARRTTRGA